MKFPENFKSFEDCEKYFSDKNAGIFHGDEKVVIRILSDNDRQEDNCVYSVGSDKSLTKESDNHKQHKSVDSSRSSETSSSNDDVTIETVKQKTVVDPKPEPSNQKKKNK